MKNALTALTIIIMAFSTTGCKLECDEWYEESDGDCVEMREKFFGTYTGTATAAGQTANAQIVISTNSSAVNNLNFLLSSGDAYLTLSNESGAFGIPMQNIYTQGVTYTIEGSGSFNGNQLVMNYVLSFQGANTTVNFTGTK